MNVSGIITLTTDFGLGDPYVGIMKGVILSINPGARLIDISHLVRPQSIIHASGLIRDACHFFPEGTIHVAVVDPGVGGERRPILVKTEGHLFVGPDNGIFRPVITTCQHSQVIHITESKYLLPGISHTFHGRDIFAPVAAHLSLGVDPLKFGPVIDDPVELHLPRPQEREGILTGEVIRVDHFGNLITNIHQKDLEQFTGTDRAVIRVANLMVEGLCNTYGEAGEGETLALAGSSGYLEISVNSGRAGDRLGINSDDIIGMAVEVSRKKGCS